MSFYSYDKQFKSFHQTQIPNVLKPPLTLKIFKVTMDHLTTRELM